MDSVGNGKIEGNYWPFWVFYTNSENKRNKTHICKHLLATQLNSVGKLGFYVSIEHQESRFSTVGCSVSGTEFLKWCLNKTVTESKEDRARLLNEILRGLISEDVYIMRSSLINPLEISFVIILIYCSNNKCSWR